jgi:hypothetical protein
MMEMDLLAVSIDVGDPGVHRHLIIRKTHSILPSFSVRLEMIIKGNQ